MITGDHSQNIMFRRLAKNSKILLVVFLSILLSALLSTYIFSIVDFKHVGRTDNYDIDVAEFYMKRELRNVKLILFYTRFFQEVWNDDISLGSRRTPLLPGRAAFEQCHHKQCEITYSQDLFTIADAVGFHGPDIGENITLPNRTRAEQIWFYYMMENPVNYNISDNLNGIFNWTMTYRKKSEIYAPYGIYMPRGLDKDSGEIDLEYKDLLVAWMVSNCRGEERNQYVMKLRKHIQVDIYGYCGFLKCPYPRRSLSCRLMLKRYKFYLAFENGNCDEYITEKYWENAIANDVIPIVMGGGNDLKSLIPNSYINVRDFKSPQELASYLIYLDKNDFAYLQYFKWKRLYKLVPLNKACAMCAALHNKDLHHPPRMIMNMREWWSKKDCRPLNLINITEKIPNDLTLNKTSLSFQMSIL